MVGMNAIVSQNVLALLKKKEKKQKDLARELGVSKQVMSNMLAGSRAINALELYQIATFLGVTMEKLMEIPVDTHNINPICAFMGEVNSDRAKRRLEIADEMADMVLFYARVSENAEQMEETWEA